MIRISQLIGALLLMLGIILLLDNSNSRTTTIFGTTFRNNSIPINSGLKGFLGIAFIVIGIYMSFPKLRELIENK